MVVVLGTASFAFGAEPKDRQALVVLHSLDFADTQRTIAELKDAGVRPAHIIPPRVVIGFVPAGAEGGAAGISNVVSIHRSAVPAIGLEKGVDLATGVSAWNHLVSQRAATPTAIPPAAKPLIGDAFEPPMPPVSRLLTGAGGLQAPDYYSTSEFMVGSVAVGVIMPESDGGTENWSTSRQDTVFNKIAEGLNWWIARANEQGVPLTFVYDQRRSVPTKYEPITREGPNDQYVWVADIFKNMGYTDGGQIDRALEYINDLRTSYNTDWCYTFIVVDSLNDTDGAFSSGYFAWSYLGGPYSVMTYDNDGWGISHMNITAAHESGHIFLAGDEYCVPGYACCDFEHYGYLDVYNGNCELNNPSSVPCIMRRSENAVCQYTNGQIGWRDTDGDDIPDTIDNVVNNTLDYHPTPALQTALTFTGNAADVPCPTPRRMEVTINRISTVKYRVDGGAWADANAADGSFNEDTENYYFTVGPLELGQHLIETQAYSYPYSGNASEVAEQYVEIVLVLPTGSLCVTINPQDAIDAGAQWRRAGTSTWFNSGDTESDISIGQYIVEFKDIAGWDKPSNQSVTISAEQTTNASGTYVIQLIGSLCVTIGPQHVIDAGAQWRRTGTSTWLNSGDTENGIRAGQHTVEFKSVLGWNKPPNQNVTIADGQTTTISTKYSILCGPDLLLTGNWENCFDHWSLLWSNCMVGFSENGGTIDGTALKINVPAGDWSGSVFLKLQGYSNQDVDIFGTAIDRLAWFVDNCEYDTFSVDVTRLAAEWVDDNDTDTTPRSEFGMVLSGGGMNAEGNWFDTGWLLTGMGNSAWNGLTDDTRTVVYDLSAAKQTLINDCWNAGYIYNKYCEIHLLPFNYGYNSPVIYYLDNAQLTGGADYSPTGDLNYDCSVDFHDFILLSDNWLETNCEATNNWCEEADIGQDGNVGLSDLAAMVENWLNNIPTEQHTAELKDITGWSKPNNQGATISGGDLLTGDWQKCFDHWSLAWGNAMLGFSGTGATLNDSSLKMVVPAGDWNNAIFLKLQGYTNKDVDIFGTVIDRLEWFADSCECDAFKVDMTRLAADWVEDNDPCATPRSELYMILNSGGQNAYGDWLWNIGLAGAANSDWDGLADDTRTVVYDLSAVKQTALDIWNAGYVYNKYCEIYLLPFNEGYTGPVTYYLDNAQLTTTIP